MTMLFAAIFALLVFGVSVSDAAPRAAGGKRRLAVRDDQPQPTGRLLGGEEIPNFDDWPFYVSMTAQYMESSSDDDDDEFYFYCPGLVFNERTIITTAQCAQDFKFFAEPNTLTVECGDNDGILALNTTSHENYDPVYTYNKTFLPNDIGLVILVEDLELDDKCQLTNLPDQDEDTEPQIATIIGYSTDDNIWYPDMDDYRKIELQILSEEDCTYYGGNYYHADMHICVRDPAKLQAACVNDQSSPVILHNDNQTVVGLGSWIYSACIFEWYQYRLEYPAFFVRLAHYIDWINDNAYNADSADRFFSADSADSGGRAE